MIGCYYHADELSSFQNPNKAHGHVHIDYIPVANNLSRGMKRQNSLVKALNEMKFETTSIHDTAQIRWQRAQNIELERICVAHGLEIEHPSREKQKHLDIKEYRQRKRIEDLEKQNAALIDKINTLIDYHNELNRTIDSLELGASELAHEIVENQFNIDRDNLIR